MIIRINTDDPARFMAITDAGLRAFDRYHRYLESKTVTLAPCDYTDKTPPSAPSAAQVQQ